MSLLLGFAKTIVEICSKLSAGFGFFQLDGKYHELTKMYFYILSYGKVNKCKLQVFVFLPSFKKNSIVINKVINSNFHF